MSGQNDLLPGGSLSGDAGAPAGVRTTAVAASAAKGGLRRYGGRGGEERRAERRERHDKWDELPG